VHKLVNIYTKLYEPVTAQYVFLWASGAPNSRAAPGSPHSSYATGCIHKVRKSEWKKYCDFVNIEYQKHIAHSVTRWLSLYASLPRMLQMYPASPSYFVYNHKPTVVVKRLFGNSLSELCWRHLQSFLVAFMEQVQNIENSKAPFVEDRKSKNMLWQTSTYVTMKIDLV